MKAIVVRRFGGPEVLALEDVPEPRPSAGEVRLRVALAGVNFTDAERRAGLNPEVTLPWIPGMEAAGVVEAVGPGGDASLIGRRMAALAASCYAEATLARVEGLMPLPDAVGWEPGAAFAMQGLTAYHLLHTAARVRSGESVLVHAAAGGVGSWCVQLARRSGARVFGTASTPDKAEMVRALGADEAFVYGPGLEAALRERTGGRGVDVVLDSVGRDTQEASLAVLAPFGRLVHFGTASGRPVPIDVEDLYERSLQVGAYWLRTAHPPEVVQQAVAVLLEGLADGSLRVPALTVVPLADAAAAHRALESRQTHGKLLLRAFS